MGYTREQMDRWARESILSLNLEELEVEEHIVNIGNRINGLLDYRYKGDSALQRKLNSLRARYVEIKGAQ